MARRPRASEDIPEGMDDGAGHQLTIGSPKPSPYSLNTPMTELGLRLIGNQDDLAQLRQFEIAFLRRDSTRTDNEFHVDSASGVFVRNERERAIYDDVHLGVWMQGASWDTFDTQQRMAWMHGLLLRFVVTEEGHVTKQRPGVVEWPSIVGRYGAWNDQLKLALELNDRRDGPLLGQPGPRRLTAAPDADTTGLAPN